MTIITGMSSDELAEFIEWEGLDYFFLYYIHPDRIEDKKLAALVAEYRAARDRIAERLKELGVDVDY